VDERQDAIERTDLANERTQLAWWRTGLTALAVALAIGRVLPELGDPTHAWPYTALGAGFGLYSFLLIGYGTIRARAVRLSLQHGQGVPSQDHALIALTLIGVILSTLTTVLIVLE
jgi:putative membrane protein